jgi:hypothetical protein
MRSTDEWIGLEGVHQGHPMLLRVRKLDLKKVRRAQKPLLFVLSWLYDADDSSLLPDASFYARLKRFEETIDEIEGRHDTIFVGTETGEGKSHYFFYTSCAQGLADFLNSKIASEENVEYSSKDDPRWEEYRRLLASTLGD